MILEIKNLTVHYQSTPQNRAALDDVSFSVNENEIVGIVGESGSGKSTLAFSILDLLPLDAYTKGDIFFRQESIFKARKTRLESLRGNNLGLIMQEPASSFNPVLSIGYQVREVLRIKKGLRAKSQFNEAIDTVFNKVRLKEAKRVLASYPHELSGGQLQRVALAMTLMLEPSLIIADEPTSSLDVTTESEIINLLKALRREYRFSMLFITHNLDLVKALCDRLVVLRAGKVVEAAAVDNFFRAPGENYSKSLLASFKELGEL
ncbi:MAG: ABC transporter ATP-binding protein [Candidatus Omnitrophota bacterium]